jgi:opacity protein-like surface antigen
MNRRDPRIRLVLAALLGLACSPAFVQAVEKEVGDDLPQLAMSDLLYRKGRISFQFMAGVLSAHRYLLHTHRQEFTYVQTNLRLGWMLNTPSDDEWILRGNFEALFEATYSKITEGFGNYMYGVTALIRYNFVRPDAKLVPYFQAGVGIVHTDAHRDMTQKLIGQSIEFTPQGSIGLRCLLAENWSFDAEFLYHHISNAGLTDRNIGVNSFGGGVGFTYLFDKPWE